PQWCAMSDCEALPMGANLFLLYERIIIFQHPIFHQFTMVFERINICARHIYNKTPCMYVLPGG
ncbi:hypothetical protein, partial [Cylindrospermopsis raciborskii]|uniref:hypothetical protein n=1 Tax=Cylindrospermopsis raciborskii TaxID=77022 RepID=UPI0038D04442